MAKIEGKFAPLTEELGEDDRFLNDLTDLQKLMYILVIYTCHMTRHKAPANPTFYKRRYGLKAPNSAVKTALEVVRTLYPKLRISLEGGKEFLSMVNSTTYRDQIVPRIRKEVEKEEEINTDVSVPRETNSEERFEPSPFEKDFHHLDRFNEFWEQYPERIERSRAIRIFSHTIQTTEQFQKLMVALGKYKKHLSLNAWKKALKPETFLMGWTDWLEWSEPATPETSKEKADQLIKNLKEIPA